jgi:hypothetical protein
MPYTDTLKKLMYRAQDCLSDLLFFGTLLGGSTAARAARTSAPGSLPHEIAAPRAADNGGAYALRPGRGVVRSMGGLAGVFRLRRLRQNAGMKHHSVGGNDSSGARSYSDDGCFWSPSPGLPSKSVSSPRAIARECRGRYPREVDSW